MSAHPEKKPFGKRVFTLGMTCFRPSRETSLRNRYFPQLAGRLFVRGHHLDDFPGVLEGCKFLVTFAGTAFDIPFLRVAFPGLQIPGGCVTVADAVNLYPLLVIMINLVGDQFKHLKHEHLQVPGVWSGEVGVPGLGKMHF